MSTPPAPPATPAMDLSGAKPKKFLNGWTKEQEELLAEWSDYAQCYRWMHDRSYKMYRFKNLAISFPVIILSTITGAASVSLQGIVGPDLDANKWGQVAIGVVSIATGIIQTLGSRLEFAQLSEGHRVVSVLWGKFQRRLAVELQLSPDDRADSMEFIAAARQELDRLIEQSPVIPESIIAKFDAEFDGVKDLKQPDVCGGIEHTRVYDSKSVRIGHLAADAALFLKIRKKALREDIAPDLDAMIQTAVREHVAKVVPAQPEKPRRGFPFMEEQMEKKFARRGSVVRSRSTSPAPSGGVGATQQPTAPSDIVVDMGIVEKK